MGGDGDDSEVETHQNFDDSNVFTRDKRVSVDIETIWVFYAVAWTSGVFYPINNPANVM